MSRASGEGRLRIRVRIHRILVAGSVLAASVLLCVQLVVPPVVGVANNGDFEKVMGYAGVQYETADADKYFTHIVTKFAYAPVWYRSGYLSSETLLARLARDASRPFSPDGRLDLRVLGALQAALLVAALGGLVGATGSLLWPAQAATAVLLVFVFTDVGYAAPLNSFYSQSASFVFLLLTAAVVATALRRKGWNAWLLAAFLLCAAGLVGSKPQESLIGPFLAVLALRIAGFSREKAERRAAAATAVALCAFAAWYYLAVPRTIIHNVALYRTVFNELLTESKDPGADLTALGLDPELRMFAGRSAYAPDTPVNDPDFGREFFARTSYGRVLRFYAERPARLLARLARAAPGGVRLRPGGLGNFAKDAPGYFPRRIARRFGIWSKARSRLVPVAPLWLGLLLGGNLAFAALGWRRATPNGRIVREALALFVLMAGIEYGVCAIADSLESVNRHLFAFQALCDLILIADLVWLAQTACRRARRTDRTPAVRAAGA